MYYAHVAVIRSGKTATGNDFIKPSIKKVFNPCNIDNDKDNG